MRLLLLPALIALGIACNPIFGPRRGLEGDWGVTLFCDDPIEGVPSCPGQTSVVMRIYGDDDAYADLTDGEHRAYFPGNEPADGSGYRGIQGAVVGSWAGADLVLDIVGYPDDPVATPEDAEAWSTHHLQIVGRPSERCWDATWSWVNDEGTVVATGEARVEHRWRACEPL